MPFVLNAPTCLHCGHPTPCNCLTLNHRMIGRLNSQDAYEDLRAKGLTPQQAEDAITNVANQQSNQIDRSDMLDGGEDSEIDWVANSVCAPDEASEDHQVSDDGVVVTNSEGDMLGDAEIDWAAWSGLPSEELVGVEARSYVNNCDKAKQALQMADHYTQQAERALDANNNHDGIDRDDMLDPNED